MMLKLEFRAFSRLPLKNNRIGFWLFLAVVAL
jgi:hypothetical protein